MTLGLAIFLGILQGLTEFFPVSSSGHLALFGHWFGLAEADLQFEILVHLATLVAILVYFRHDWVQLVQNFFGMKNAGDFPKWMWVYVGLSMIPAALVGIFLKDTIAHFHGEPWFVGLCLIATGTALFFGKKVTAEGLPMTQFSLKICIIMGLVQALAVLPGVSRSGSTILAGVFAGMSRHAAARFSFLMAVPVIGGAGFLEVLKLYKNAETMPPGMMTAYLAGSAAALISGFVALRFLMSWLEGRRFFDFCYYCWAMGAVAILSTWLL